MPEPLFTRIQAAHANEARLRRAQAMRQPVRSPLLTPARMKELARAAGWGWLAALTFGLAALLVTA